MYDLDQFIGYDKFRDHLDLVPRGATFNLFLFDSQGAVQNLVNMASLLRAKFPTTTVNLVALDGHLHPRPQIDRRIRQNLRAKGVEVYLNADLRLDPEQAVFSVLDSESGECLLAQRKLEFTFFSSFRKWPGFLAKSGVFEEDFCPTQLAHRSYPNICAGGSLLNPQASLAEKYSQSTVMTENVEREVEASCPARDRTRSPG